MVREIDGKEMLRLGTMGKKVDIELYALGLTPGVPSSKKFYLLPGLHQESVLDFLSPPGSLTVTTPGCHCGDSLLPFLPRSPSSSPPPRPNSRTKHLVPLVSNSSGPGFPVCPVPGFHEDPELVLLNSRNAGTLVPRPSVTPSGP